jgi:hypothetical protein
MEERIMTDIRRRKKTMRDEEENGMNDKGGKK